ncbi:MAG: acetoacetate--CoA ligase [Halobacteriovoraceae bacterium]|nr:acetoacetate--CoA ligase [Halobacteriovoraceae bacterium]
MERKVLWKPSDEAVKNSQMAHFMKHIENRYSQEFSHYNDLHQWSVENTEDFWNEIFLYFNLNHEGENKPVALEQSFLKYPWFPNVKLNFAENLLAKGKESDCALNFFHESGLEKKINYGQLKSEVARVTNYLESTGFREGDVLACYMPNIPETVMSMLSCTSLGGCFTSTSCDFGLQGVIDRFSQSKPKILVMATGYQYNGKYFDLSSRVKELKANIPSIEKIILVDFLGQFDKNSFQESDCEFWDEIGRKGSRDGLTFKRVSFASPLYIMYSSGTTGKPKCIVHSVGGTLLQHLKELALHCDLKQNEKIFYFTTCGWMMWNWLVSSLAIGAEVFLYEGSPGYPSLDEFVKKIDEKKIALWGTSPKFIRALEVNDWKRSGDFKYLRCLLSTGAPLLPEQFDYIYESIKTDLQVASICGGTDIISCFMLGNPLRQVYRGEIQCLGLGMDVACFDGQGKPVYEVEGELVCRKPFISQPIYFLDDSDCTKIKKAYFNRFAGVWHHGDFVTLTKDKTVIVFGRSDATLNPGGVRIGTGEIYRQTEKISYIDDTLCVGVQNSEGDVDIVLFVKMRDDNEKLDENKIKEIKTFIRSETTPRHVPKNIYQVTGIPYTRSGKKMELAITRMMNGKPLDNKEAMANPECLKEYEQFV